MATLTIADLDNGKRDLQTVSEVANSRAATATTRFGAQTTTLYEAIRRVEERGDSILRNLGFFPPVDYASGLSVETTNFTVNHDGVVYAAQPGAVPFTTGAWDAQQWYPLQNIYSDHNLLVFESFAEASAAAATLSDGQEVEAPDADGRLARHVVQSRGLVFKDYAPDAIRMQSYTALRAYTGKAQAIDITTPGVAGRFYLDETDTTTADDGGTVIVTTDGKRLKRKIEGRVVLASWFLESGVSIPDAVVKAIAATPDGYKCTIDVGAFTGNATVGGGRKLSRDAKMGGRITGKITTTASHSNIEEIEIEQVDSGDWAIDLQNPDDGNYYNTVRDVLIRGQHGIRVDATESRLENVRHLGVRANQQVEGYGLKIENFDAQVTNYYCEEVKYGIQSAFGVEAIGTHIVRADRAIQLSDRGVPANIVNTYLDGPRVYGAVLGNMVGASLLNTNLLRVGRWGTDPSNASGFWLHSNSSSNKIAFAHFSQPAENEADWRSGIRISADSKNNLIIGVSGSYKMNATDIPSMRSQTVLGCSDGWARFNNVTRKLRARADNLAPGAETTLVFDLDYALPSLTSNIVLFRGAWAARSASASTGAYGQVHLHVGGGTTGFGTAGVVSRLNGPSNFDFEIVSCSVSGNVLSVVIKNNYSSQAHIALELERSVDPIFATV